MIHKIPALLRMVASNKASIGLSLVNRLEDRITLSSWLRKVNWLLIGWEQSPDQTLASHWLPASYTGPRLQSSFAMQISEQT